MEDKESGSLSQKPALGLIVELYTGGVTGSLKLERAPLQKAVYFRDGQILFAASNDPKDQLASILVEEGKLGPDQMQVAQARVSSGNPLAKVLTELGYISQRELADAARIKVEKILTDLYTWTEGTYQFATKSLPKGAIDLDLSTPQLIYASIGRIQDRDWILKELESLEAVLSPSPALDNFISDTKVNPQASEILRHADGVKTVKQIAALSSMGEFEVCKILTAALVVGALTKSGASAAPVAASDEAFSFPTDEPSFEPQSQPEIPNFGGVETVGIPTSPPPPPAAADPFTSAPPPPAAADDAFQAPDATVFEPPSETDKTVFDPSPSMGGGLPPEPPESPPPSFPSMEAPSSTTASELLIDEPQRDFSDDPGGRVPPRPKNMRGGGSSSGKLGGILKIAGVVVLAAVAAFSVYYFVWPMFSGGGDESGQTQTATATPTPGSSSSGPPAATTAPPAAGGDPRATRTPTNAGPNPPATSSTPEPAPAGGPSPPTPRPSPPTTTSAPPRPAPAPAPSPPAGGSTGGGARQLLASGNLSGAASAFQSQLRSSGSNKFTIAVGLYCNEENVGRIVRSAGGSEQLYVLPTTMDGRRCYRVVWGLFDSRQAAENGKGQLPSGVVAGDTAAVPLAGLLR